MSVRRTFAQAVFVASTCGLPFLVMVDDAHADNESHQTQTFTFHSAATGNPVTCSVEAYAAVFGASDDPRREAFASVKAYGDVASCNEGTASLSATYRNSSGVDVRGGAGGEQATYWTADDVGAGAPNLVVEHSFVFSDCLANCSLTITTAPK